MKAVFDTDSLAEAYYVRDLLRERGIMAEVGNEALYQLWGGSTPELSERPTVWVTEESRAEEAERIIRDRTPHATEEEWNCAKCGNPNPGTFTACWNCETERESD